MADMLMKFGAAVLGPLAVVSEPVRLALLYWYRRSELSADRAAAAVLKSPRPVMDAMVRLAGGPKSITEKVNLDLYMKQAEAYDKLHESQWNKFLQNVAVMHMEHPFLAVRTREISRWCESEHFQRLLQALDEAEKAATAPKCLGCGHPLQERWKFCGVCGHPNPFLAIAPQHEEPLYG